VDNVLTDKIADKVQLMMRMPDDMPAGRWLRLRYRMALCRSAARPVIRFDVGSEEMQNRHGGCAVRNR